MTGHHAVALLVMAEGEANSEAGKAKLFTPLLCSCLNLLLWVTEGLSGPCQVHAPDGHPGKEKG